MTLIDFSGALEIRIAGQDVQTVQISGQTIWNKPVEGPVFFENFETMPAGSPPVGWTATGVTQTVTTTTPINGLQGLNLAVSNTGRRWTSRDVTGLVIGQKYRLSAIARPLSTASADVGVLGIGVGTAITGDGTNKTPTYEFTATATTHTIQLGMTRISSTISQARWDDVTITKVP